MELWRSVGGMVLLRITAPDPAQALTAVSATGIRVYDSELTGDLTFELRIPWRDMKKLRSLSKRKGYEFKVLKREGVFWTAAGLRRRPVLLIGVAALLLGIMLLPGRILFVQVEGNSAVPTKQILEYAQQCGIGFGTNRRQVRSEKLKNALLEKIPRLQWVGVNTKGCVAVISVRERSEADQLSNGKSVGSIVALRDGVIESCNVTRGNKLCKPGQAVTAGQVLISGYTDCGLSITATRAEGEVYAKTQRDLQVIAPCETVQRGELTSSGKRISLIFGKKRINFYQGSGISGAECVRMYKESYVTLPGGFQLPVRVAVEEWFCYQMEEFALSSEEVSQQLTDFSARYLKDTMVAGSILSAEESISEDSEIFQLTGKYACLEMIGQLRSEEIIKPNGNDN